MIINVRGTSGSGKSYLIRSIMDLYGSRLRYRETGRKRPLGYLCLRPAGGRSLAVIGHYETACGGCDTIPTLETAFGLVRMAHTAGHDVLFEGLLINSDRKRTIEMHEDSLPLTVITLDTPLDLCLESVKLRRTAKAGDNAKELNPRNTQTKYELSLINHQKFREAGLDAQLLTRTDAQRVIRELLSV